jgi:predicted transcriptional regulator
MSVSIRLSEAIKRRIARLARAHDKTVHAFMLEAIQEKVESEEMRAQFHAEAKRRLVRMKKSGLAIPAEEAFDYLSARARGEATARPRPRKLP